jgi:hypothetical protein
MLNLSGERCAFLWIAKRVEYLRDEKSQKIFAVRILKVGGLLTWSLFLPH